MAGVEKYTTVLSDWTPLGVSGGLRKTRPTTTPMLEGSVVSNDHVSEVRGHSHDRLYSKTN